MLDGAKRSGVEGPAIAFALVFSRRGTNVGCPRSPGFGDLGYHEPRRAFAFRFSAHPSLKLVILERSAAESKDLRLPLHLFSLAEAQMLGAPGLPVLETWDTTNLEGLLPFAFLPTLPSSLSSWSEAQRSRRTCDCLCTCFLSPRHKCWVLQVSRFWRPGIPRTSKAFCLSLFCPPFPQACHPERSAAESKDLQLLFVTPA